MAQIGIIEFMHQNPDKPFTLKQITAGANKLLKTRIFTNKEIDAHLMTLSEEHIRDLSSLYYFLSL